MVASYTGGYTILFCSRVSILTCRGKESYIYSNKYMLCTCIGFRFQRPGVRNEQRFIVATNGAKRSNPPMRA